MVWLMPDGCMAAAITCHSPHSGANISCPHLSRSHAQLASQGFLFTDTRPQVTHGAEANRVPLCSSVGAFSDPSQTRFPVSVFCFLCGCRNGEHIGGCACLQITRRLWIPGCVRFTPTWFCAIWCPELSKLFLMEFEVCRIETLVETSGGALSTGFEVHTALLCGFLFSH